MLGFTYKENELFCENTPVKNIINEVGTPAYIYSKAAFISKFNSIYQAFSEIIDTTVCYSVKSCSNINILKELATLGASFDVVSGGELYRVIAAGADPKKTVFAGVGKTDHEIKYALGQDIMLFNCESEAEISNINKIAGELGKTAPVSLRINPDIDAKSHAKTTTGTKENKFGIDFARAMQLVSRLSSFKNITLKGVDIHLGSPVNSLDAYREAIARVLDFTIACPDTLEFFDVGGGFGLIYDEEDVPSFNDYAEIIATPVKKSGLKLIIEPGRTISGNAGILVGEVQYTKRTGIKNFVMLDVGMNDLVRPAMYDAYHFIWPVSTEEIPDSKLFPELIGGGLYTPQDITGPICESSDVFCKERELPELNRGDLVAIFSTGAYGSSMSSNYNSHPKAVEVLVDGKKFKIIRMRETYDDIIAKELIG